MEKVETLFPGRVACAQHVEFVEMLQDESLEAIRYVSSHLVAYAE